MFEDIKPYDDLQASSALKRVASNPAIDSISDFLYPGSSHDNLRSLLSSVTGVDDFQEKVMYGAIGSIVKKTTSGLTFGGLEHFRNGDGSFNNYLLLSNHRDIVLDPAFIQYILKDNHLPSTEIAVGDNLISSQFVEDLMRSNRMIKVKRSGSARELYYSSVELSEYIRMKIAGGTSVWIAHRNGRTKDGCDATSQGILKMFSMSGPDDFSANFKDLKIMPVSISYEIEPCGIEKALETYLHTVTGSYKKAEGEDLRSILTGIIQQKGHVHIQFCNPLTDSEIDEAASYGKNDNMRHLCEIIDSRIIQGYRIWPNNIVAAGKAVQEGLSEASVNSFNALIGENIGKIDMLTNVNNYQISDIQSVSDIRNIFVNIYSSPYNRKCGNNE